MIQKCVIKVFSNVYFLESFIEWIIKFSKENSVSSCVVGGKMQIVKAFEDRGWDYNRIYGSSNEILEVGSDEYLLILKTLHTNKKKLEILFSRYKINIPVGIPVIDVSNIPIYVRNNLYVKILCNSFPKLCLALLEKDAEHVREECTDLLKIQIVPF